MYRVYIDEAGDRGMKPASSEYFLVSAVIVKDELDPEVRRELARLRETLRRPPDQVLHFRKMAHASKVRSSAEIGESSIAAITNVIMCKRLIQDPAGPGGAAYISTPDPMYLYALRMLWERISWFVRDQRDGRAAKVMFAQIKHFKVEKIQAYRKKLESGSTKIEWKSFDGHPFVMRGMEEREMLQIADCSASSLAAAIEPNNLGDVEDRYLRNLAPKLYRYKDKPNTAYGLKVYPPAAGEAGGRLHHLNAY